MQPEPDFIIDAHKRREMVPYSDPYIAHLERENKFPQRIKLGKNGRVGWSLREVQDWIEERKAERPDHALAVP